MNKQGILGLIVFILVLLIAGFFIFIKYNPSLTGGVINFESNCSCIENNCVPKKGLNNTNNFSNCSETCNFLNNSCA